MVACPRCGYGNDDGADFCANPDCRGDLRALTPTVRPTPEPQLAPSAPAPPYPGPTRGPAPPSVPSQRGQPTAPLPPPPPPVEPTARHGVHIALEPSELSVEPGSTATTLVTVRNTGSLVEQFQLAVNGPVAAFARVEPPVLSVFPDDEATAVVHFSPPRAAEPPAGRAPFQVTVRSAVHSGVGQRAAGTVTIGRFDQLQATIEPEVTRGRKPGRHRVSLVNNGNAPTFAQVALTDRDGELTYDRTEATASLANGDTQDADFVIGG